MVAISRGEIWWADLSKLTGSEPGFHRPMLVVQSDAFNRSNIQTVVRVALASNLASVFARAGTLGVRGIAKAQLPIWWHGLTSLL
jgi:mRNA-degrading endonuclease toxin of MazEF toxin-antitoxin module